MSVVERPERAAMVEIERLLLEAGFADEDGYDWMVAAVRFLVEDHSRLLRARLAAWRQAKGESP